MMLWRLRQKLIVMISLSVRIMVHHVSVRLILYNSEVLLCISGLTQCQGQQTITHATVHWPWPSHSRYLHHIHTCQHWYFLLCDVIVQCSNWNPASFIHCYSLLYSLYFDLTSNTVYQWFCSVHCYMSVSIPCVIPVYNNYCLHVIVNLCRDICYGVDMPVSYTHLTLPTIYSV